MPGAICRFQICHSFGRLGYAAKHAWQHSGMLPSAMDNDQHMSNIDIADSVF